MSILLAGGVVVYAERLWIMHSVPYERLPDLFVTLDVMEPDGRFHTVEERNERVAAVGLVVPPLFFSGVLRRRLALQVGRDQLRAEVRRRVASVPPPQHGGTRPRSLRACRNGRTTRTFGTFT